MYTNIINILIADDHQIITDGIASMLTGEKQIGEVLIARNGREALEKVLDHAVDCIILDINMPELNGLEVAKLVKQQKPLVKIIVVSMVSEASIVSRMLKAGVDAFLNKNTGKEELLNAIRRVMLNEKYLGPDIAFTLFKEASYKVDKTTDDPAAQLTRREREIIRLIGNGMTNHEIALKLFLSTVTVNTHRKNILLKLQLRNTASLVKFAAEHKLLE